MEAEIIRGTVKKVSGTTVTIDHWDVELQRDQPMELEFDKELTREEVLSLLGNRIECKVIDGKVAEHEQLFD